jgi:hypothetical protein
MKPADPSLVSSVPPPSSVMAAIRLLRSEGIPLLAIMCSAPPPVRALARRRQLTPCCPHARGSLATMQGGRCTCPPPFLQSRQGRDAVNRPGAEPNPGQHAPGTGG